MSEEYKIKMARAEHCEQVIARFRGGDDSSGPIRLSFASKAQRDWQEVVRSYQEALDIYHQLNQQESAKRLLNNLFDLVQTCDEFTSSLAIGLLLTLKSSHTWIEQVAPGTQNQLKTALRAAIGQKLLEKEMEFWLLLSSLGLLRDLASDDLERRTVDSSSCQVMELGAQLSFRRGNLDTAERWYRDAARIAQDKLGDSEWASHLLQIAAYVQQIATGHFPRSPFAQAPQRGAPSASDPVETIHRVDTVECLEAILCKEMEGQHSERFLPSVQELVADYEPREDKLSALLADERLLLDKSRIDQREAKYHGKGLSGWIAGQFVDSQGNPRGDFESNARFTVQHVAEVAEAIGVLFSTWQEKAFLTQSGIAYLLTHHAPYYDWRVYEAGLGRHFQSDFVCAAHVLAPQFENVVRVSAQVAGIEIKKFKGGVPGDVLLNDLIYPDNREMRELLGAGLFDLVYWYLANGGSPFGYRHKIAHGWIRFEDCNQQLSAMTIWLTLKVIHAISRVTGGKQSFPCR